MWVFGGDLIKDSKIVGHVYKLIYLQMEQAVSPLINVCYKSQHLTDHIIFMANKLAAESRSHPLLNTSCVGTSCPLQLSGSLSEQFDMTTRLPTTTRQPDRSNIDLPVISQVPGAGASMWKFV